MNDTTENFWQVWNSLEPWSPPVVFWRLYHDDRGRPLFYSQEDKPGNYIDVTPEQYALASMNVRVREGKLIELTGTVFSKLRPKDTGTPCDPRDITVVVPLDRTHQCWSLTTNDNEEN